MDTQDLTVLFDTYCEACCASDWQLLESLQEMSLDELICQNKQAAFSYLYSDISLKKKLVWLNKLFTDCGFKDYDRLLDLLNENSKLIRRNIEKIFLDKEKKTRKLLEKRFPFLDEDTQNWARQLFKYWDNSHAAARKIKFKNKQEVVNYCSKHIELYCTQQIAWLPQKPYTRIHWAGETDVDEFVPRHVIRYVLSEYISLTQITRLHACDAVVPFIEEKEWQAALDELLRYWLSEGAEANRRTILLPYCLYASEEQIFQLVPVVRSWMKTNRKQLALFALKALGLRASAAALIVLNDWSELSHNRTYRRAAWEAFRQVADDRGLTTEELADRIIPSFGFNPEGEKMVDYGTRTFRVTLLPDFSVSVFDYEKNMERKSLPVPLKTENRELIESYRKESEDAKKLIKRQTHVQAKRMENVIKNGRTWPKNAWLATFIENPVMRYMTNGLVWGIYKDGKLQQSFRPVDHATFIMAEAEAFALPDDADIALVHPIDLTDETLAQWKKQLEKEKIAPFVSQLDLPVFRLGAADKSEDAITRYSGKPIQFAYVSKYESIDVSARLENDTLYLADKVLNMVIQLPFLPGKDGYRMQEIYFSPLKEGEDINQLQLPLDERLPLASIPERVISSVLDLLNEAFSLEE